VKTISQPILISILYHIECTSVGTLDYPRADYPSCGLSAVICRTNYMYVHGQMQLTLVQPVLSVNPKNTVQCIYTAINFIVYNYSDMVGWVNFC